MIVSAQALAGGGHLQAASFPGRWNPRRAIPPEAEPAASASARALEAAGWWLPESGAEVDAGLVVAVDGAHLPAARRFAQTLRERPDAAHGPADFLFSLPSTPAAVLGLLFGLRRYQATCVGGQEVGFRALRHGLDLLALKRLSRLCLVFLLVRDRERQAVAWCLDPSAPSPLAGLAFDPEGEGAAGQPTQGRTSCPTLMDPPPLPSGENAPTIFPFQEPASLELARATAWLQADRAAGDRRVLASSHGSFVLTAYGRKNATW